MRSGSPGSATPGVLLAPQVGGVFFGPPSGSFAVGALRLGFHPAQRVEMGGRVEVRWWGSGPAQVAEDADVAYILSGAFPNLRALALAAVTHWPGRYVLTVGLRGIGSMELDTGKEEDQSPQALAGLQMWADVRMGVARTTGERPITRGIVYLGLSMTVPLVRP